MKKNTQNHLNVGIPTHDGRAIIYSCIELFALSGKLGRTMKLMIGEAGNIPRARNTVMDQVRQDVRSNEGVAWVLWLDSDIVIPTGGHVQIANAIEWSEQTGQGWVANYKTSEHKNVLLKQKDYLNATHYTNEELDQLPPFAEVGMAGFGLAYLPMDLRYVFHADRWGEDVHYFIDQPNLKIHYAKDIVLNHKKIVQL